MIRTVYKQKTKASKPVTKSVKCWNTDNTEKLKACYECTNSPGNMWIYLEQIATVLKHTFSYP